MFRATALAAVVTLVTGVSTAGAQDAVLAEVYGEGVHHYFAHEYDEAYQDLTLAIDHGLRDPRVYYFRGLVSSATGRPDEAAGDWRIGAVLEARGNYSGSIGRALSRIQGAERIELENIRQLARLEERSRTAAQSRARYEGAEGSVLPDAPAPPAPAPPAPLEPAAPATPAPAVPAPATPAPTAPVPSDPLDTRVNPFADDEGISVGEPTVESENALSDPFSQPAPAADAPATPAEQPPADTDTPPADPFGDLDSGDAESNPFGL